jgi:hypothetical protein
MKKLNFLLLIVFGFLMTFSLVALFIDDGKEFVPITLDYFVVLEGTIVEAAIFVVGAIGFFSELMYFNLLSFYKEERQQVKEVEN